MLERERRYKIAEYGVLSLMAVQGLFQQRRAEHKAAVETILNFRDNEKQQKMVNIIATKAFEVRCGK